jgi:hypothetical protein
MDRLIQEIIKFHGSETITFTHGNNREGTIVVLPSFQTLDRYSAELSKRESAINSIINSIMKSTGSTEEKSAECLLNILFSRFEETFVSLCMEKGLLHEKSQKRWISSALRTCYRRLTSIIPMQGFFSDI